MTFNPQDHYFKKAKRENFAARSVFKLQEINERHRLFKPGQRVLDLGAAPGSWSQYAVQQIGENGRLLGIDLTPITMKLKNAVFLAGDLMEMDLALVMREHGFDEPFSVVMSDMAPKTTGIKMTDQARSAELCELALDIACRFLQPKGAFVCKLFHGDDFVPFRDRMRQVFERVDVIKPKATRRISKEIFLVGLSRKTECKSGTQIT